VFGDSRPISEKNALQAVKFNNRTMLHFSSWHSWEWVVWWYLYRARSRQLANADQYCMEITGFEDTAKHLLTTALPENRPPNRNRGFFLKTEPKPTDLGQCETVTTLFGTQCTYTRVLFQSTCACTRTCICALSTCNISAVNLARLTGPSVLDWYWTAGLSRLENTEPHQFGF